MTTGLCIHPLDPRVRISDNLTDLDKLVPGETKLVEIENSVPEELTALANELTLDRKASLIRAWAGCAPVTIDPQSGRPVITDYANGIVTDSLKRHTPEALFADVMDLCTLHHKSYGSDMLNVTFLSCEHRASATYGFHFDTPSSAEREQIRLGRVYKGEASEWLPLAEDIDRNTYKNLREYTEGNVFKKIFNEATGEPYPVESLQAGTTAAWRGLSKAFNDPNTGLFHRRVHNLQNRLAVVVDGWMAQTTV